MQLQRGSAPSPELDDPNVPEEGEAEGARMSLWDHLE